MKRARVIDVGELLVCVIPIVHFLTKCAVLIKFIWRNIIVFLNLWETSNILYKSQRIE